MQLRVLKHSRPMLLAGAAAAKATHSTQGALRAYQSLFYRDDKRLSDIFLRQENAVLRAYFSAACCVKSAVVTGSACASHVRS